VESMRAMNMNIQNILYICIKIMKPVEIVFRRRRGKKGSESNQGTV
jgi:hypothetical protein